MVEKELKTLISEIPGTPNEVLGRLKSIVDDVIPDAPKRIVILSASPQRDKDVDDLIAQQLRGMGHEVWVKKCLREGRDIHLYETIKPNIVVVPPIRNPYSRDFAVQLKKWGVAVASRHTEASIDWTDWKVIDQKQRSEILGLYPYNIDLELVWGQDEAEILRRRGAPFPIEPVGSFSADKYLNKQIQERNSGREKFNQKYGFSEQKTILILSPWGFADSAPDLRIDETAAVKKDLEGRVRHLDMIEQLHKSLGKKYNILVTIHPGVLSEPYKARLDRLHIPLSTESSAIELLLNSDILIHAGSTTAIGAHFLGKPAFQFGDVNSKDASSWWSANTCPLSRVSKKFDKTKGLVSAIKKSHKGSNANKKTLEELEKGRFGKMDGQAAVRAAKLISKLNGEFRMQWPDSPHQYDQIVAFAENGGNMQYAMCGVCKKRFVRLTEKWMAMTFNALKMPPEKRDLFRSGMCPHCGARFFLDQ